jgi:hypothetical protein
MKDIVVSMAVSRVEGMLAENVRRLSAAGITVSLESIDAQQFTIASKLQGIRRLAHKFADYGFLVVSDGWDVLFYGTKPELIGRIPKDRVLWAAEKNCWPCPDLEDKVPANGPWRFVNGGLLAGTPDSYLSMCRLIEAHPMYNPDFVDQGFMNYLLAQGADFFSIDSMTRLFFCLFKGYDELAFHRGRPINTFYGTQPLFLHANGHWPADEMFQRYEASLA